MKKTILIPILGMLILASCNQNKKPSSRLEGDWDGCVVGMFTAAENGYFPGDGIKAITGFEELIEHEVGSVVWFPTWDDPFPVEACEEARKKGIIPHITWELFWPSKNPNHTRNIDQYEAMDEVLAGKHDAYIDRFALAAKEYGGVVLNRFLHEFNGNWYVWSGNKNGREDGGPEKVIKVWKYVVDRFRENGAYNVKWLWTPHGPSADLSCEAWNDIENYWPGSEYVDWIGLDGYNFYPKDPWGGERPYRDFDNNFKELYEACAKLGEQPMMIAEFGTGEFVYNNLTKADWIKDAFNKIKNDYPRIKIFTWFHINKECDWRVNSSDEALSAFKQAMKDPYYIASPF
ncbi:glycoside hydrolase family 26 protein [Saccharicrinis sp. 156]|uniref:glycoside hydrolase family 26 protein n=1 Tax=Saccharicrinis sp. 156 TaxID=3417574 RepID=UPI003D3480C8